MSEELHENPYLGKTYSELQYEASRLLRKGWTSCLSELAAIKDAMDKLPSISDDAKAGIRESIRDNLRRSSYMNSLREDPTLEREYRYAKSVIIALEASLDKMANVTQV